MGDYEFKLVSQFGLDYKTRKIAFVSSDRISFIDQELISGTSKNHKEWHRWRNTIEFSLSTRRAGSLMVYNKSYGKGRARSGKKRDQFFSNVSNHPRKYYFSPDTAPLISEFLNKDIKSREDLALVIYPSLVGLNINTIEYIPPELSRHLRNPDFSKFVRRAFRAVNYRKDLVKSLRNVSIDEAAHGQQLIFSGIPVDWVIEGFRSDNKVTGPSCAPEVLNMISPVLARRLILSNPYDNAAFRERQLMSDVDRMWKETEGYPEGRERQLNILRAANSWVDVHDIWMRNGNNPRRYGRARAAIKNLEINPTKAAKALIELETEGYEVVLPKETDQLLNWSDEMNNCIRSYADEAVSGSVTLGGIYENDKLIANFEIRDDKLNQLLGKMNQQLSMKWQQRIVRDFERSGAIKEYRGAWGVSFDDPPRAEYVLPEPRRLQVPVDNGYDYVLPF